MIAAAGVKPGIEVADGHCQDVSDNLIAAENVHVVDGLGPVGSKNHSGNEYNLKKALTQRALLIAGTTLEHWKKYGGRGKG